MKKTTASINFIRFVIVVVGILQVSGCSNKSDVVNLNCDVEITYRDQVGRPTATTETVKEKIFYQLRKANYEERGDESPRKVFDWVLIKNQKYEMHGDKEINLKTQQKETTLIVDSEKIQYKDKNKFMSESSEPQVFLEELNINRMTGKLEGYTRSGNSFVINSTTLNGQCVKVDDPKF